MNLRRSAAGKLIGAGSAYPENWLCLNEKGRDGANSEEVFLNSVVGAVQCKRAATGAGRVENGANKANRQLKVKPYATMVFGSISADVRAKTNPIPWSSTGNTCSLTSAESLLRAIRSSLPGERLLGQCPPRPLEFESSSVSSRRKPHPFTGRGATPQAGFPQRPPNVEIKKR